MIPQGAIFEPDYPLEYTGDDAAGLLYGDWVRVVHDDPTAQRVEVEDSYDRRHYLVPRWSLRPR